MFIDYLRSLPQYLLPQHLISRLFGFLANVKQPWLKNSGIRVFINFYKVDMTSALEENPEKYLTFNDFFTRKLKADARPIDQQKNAIVSPADGKISQMGKIANGRLLQAKGHDFSLHELLGGNSQNTEKFLNGDFSTIYLSPKDYHRVHMPFTGTLKEMIYIPGKLFAVNDSAAKTIPQLFSQNERVVCLFETAAGPMAVILVGAMIVGSIYTKWHGQVTPDNDRKIRTWSYPNSKTPTIELKTGEELGHFQLGSTAIILFAENKSKFIDTLASSTDVKMGELLGKTILNT